MRIRFYDAENAHESARRLRLNQQIESFWREIAALAPARSVTLAELPASAQRALQAVHPELDCELMGESHKPPNRLVLSARGEPRLRQLIVAIVERAPELPGLTVLGERPPLGTAEALARVRAASGLELGGARVRAGFTRGHLLTITIHDAAFVGLDPVLARETSELLCEGVLGERVLGDWVDSVDAVPLARTGPLRVLDSGVAPAALAPLTELAATVRAGIEGLLAGLSDEPCHASHKAGDWTMFETEPERADDWSDQDDLLMATTSMPEMLKSFLQGARFYSGRFSRHAERFCYLKLDTLGLDSRARLAQRSALEDALDRALVNEQLGCVIGNGFGVRYSYVDLALSNLDAAVDRVRQLARELDVQRRSWLLFFDAELADEWLGVWPDAAPPPGFSEG